MWKGAAPIAIAMTADRWQTKENAEFIRQLGFFHQTRAPLRENGSNHIKMSNFAGCGLMLRLADPEGVSLAGS